MSFYIFTPFNHRPIHMQSCQMYYFQMLLVELTVHWLTPLKLLILCLSLLNHLLSSLIGRSRPLHWLLERDDCNQFHRNWNQSILFKSTFETWYVFQLKTLMDAQFELTNGSLSFDLYETNWNSSTGYAINAVIAS